MTSLKVGQASACHPQPVGQASACHARRRDAFTLVELLVVIGIIGLLAALLTPVVMQSLTKARNAAIKSEIDMLHMAIMNYKNEYGSFPPSADSTGYPAPPTPSPARTHIERLFPRCLNAAAQLTAFGFPGQTPWPAIEPRNSIVIWLNGYTTNPQSPLRPDTDRKRLYDFDRSRITADLHYHPSRTPDSPYVFIRSGASLGSGYGVIASAGPSAGVSNVTHAGVFKPQVQITASGTNFFNSDTFQILCAGKDGIWDEDSNLNGFLEPAEDVNGNGIWDKSDDDLSNFWPGTRREYLDSLKD